MMDTIILCFAIVITCVDCYLAGYLRARRTIAKELRAALDAAGYPPARED